MSKPSKGEQTKARILAEAMTLFSEQSFDRVSVRAIAKAAGVDAALINHYFGSKEGLFSALMDEHLQFARAESSLFSAHAPDELGRAFVLAVDATWSSPTGRVMLALARRSLASDVKTLREFFSNMLFARLSPHIEGDDAERQLRACLVSSQMVGMVITRHIFRLEPLASMPREHLADLIGPTIQHYLTGDLSTKA